jgi:modulator of FtsH protease
MLAEVAPQGWNTFYAAVAGSAASLAGLMFVALSINLSRILAAPGLTGRAGESLAVLTAALITALLALVPGQAPTLMGSEIIVIGLVAWIFPVQWQIRSVLARHLPGAYVAIARLLLHQSATLPLLWGGLALTGVAPYGRDWLALGLILAMVSSVINAWVLLVEVMR